MVCTSASCAPAAPPPAPATGGMETGETGVKNYNSAIKLLLNTV